MPRRLILGQHLLQRILEHCQEEKPYEACGILTGNEYQVRHAYATANAMHSPVYYEVDQRQQEAVLREMTERGESLVAIYHSHPTSVAYPSANDIRMAVHYPEAIRLIVSLAAGPAHTRAFLITNGNVEEVQLDLPQDGAGHWHDFRGSDW